MSTHKKPYYKLHSYLDVSSGKWLPAGVDVDPWCYDEPPVTAPTIWHKRYTITEMKPLPEGLVMEHINTFAIVTEDGTYQEVASPEHGRAIYKTLGING